MSTLEHIRIVLCNTSHPGNIGAAARAMKTMGLSHLYLVQPQNYPNAEATARASGADDVLAAAQVCADLHSALADCVLVIGASARERRLEWPSLSPKTCADRLLATASAKASGAENKQNVALVFGCERSGLNNEELARCHYLVTIPANPAYSSLNLAMAVQVLCYELRCASQELQSPPTVVDAEDRLATVDEFEGFFQHLQQTLEQIEMLSPEQPRSTLLRRLRRLFYRTELTQIEINILRGILSAVTGVVPKSR